MIRQQGDARLAIAPVDLPRAGTGAAGWERVNLADANVRQTFKALHHSPNGDFVRDRIDEFNHSRQWLAVRVKLEKPEDDIGNLSHCNAQTATQKLILTNQMPDVTARLFDSIPTGWSPWIRVASWPASAQDGNSGSPVTVSLTLPQGVAGRRLELLVLCRLQQVDGARLISRTAACPTRACTSSEMLTRIILEPISPRISLTVQPEPDFNQLNPDSAASQRLQLKQGRVIWVQTQTAAEPKTLSLNSFSYNPTPIRDSFIAKLTYQKDYIKTGAGSINIKAIDIAKFTKDSVLNIGKIIIDKPYFADYKDKNLSFAAGTIKPLPVSMIKEISFPLSVDTVQINNASVEYTEVSNKTKLSGTVPVTRMAITLLKVKNYALGTSDSLTIPAVGYVMDTVWIRLRVKESYTDSLGGFLMTLQLKPGDLTVLNTALIPLASVKLISGKLDTLSMRAVGRK